MNTTATATATAIAAAPEIYELINNYEGSIKNTKVEVEKIIDAAWDDTSRFINITRTLIVTNISLRNEIDVTKERIAELTKKVEMAIPNVAGHIDVETQGEIDALNAELAKSNAKLAKYRDKYAAALSELSDNVKQTEQLTRYIDNVQNQLTEAKNGRTIAEDEARKLWTERQDMAALQNDLASSLAEIEKLKATTSSSRVEQSPRGDVFTAAERTKLLGKFAHLGSQALYLLAIVKSQCCTSDFKCIEAAVPNVTYRIENYNNRRAKESAEFGVEYPTFENSNHQQVLAAITRDAKVNDRRQAPTQAAQNASGWSLNGTSNQVFNTLVDTRTRPHRGGNVQKRKPRNTSRKNPRNQNSEFLVTIPDSTSVSAPTEAPLNLKVNNMYAYSPPVNNASVLVRQPAPSLSPPRNVTSVMKPIDFDTVKRIAPRDKSPRTSPRTTPDSSPRRILATPLQPIKSSSFDAWSASVGSMTSVNPLGDDSSTAEMKLKYEADVRAQQLRLEQFEAVKIAAVQAKNEEFDEFDTDNRLAKRVADEQQIEATRQKTTSKINAMIEASRIATVKLQEQLRRIGDSEPVGGEEFLNAPVDRSLGGPSTSVKSAPLFGRQDSDKESRMSDFIEKAEREKAARETEYKRLMAIPTATELMKEMEKHEHFANIVLMGKSIDWLKTRLTSEKDYL